DPKFDTVLGRKGSEDELDENMRAWTGQFDSRELMVKLQAAGIRAGIFNQVRDLYTDPQYIHRNIWRGVEHPEMGVFHYQGPPFELSETPAVLDRPSPCLGEHNEYFFKELFGMTGEEYQELVAGGAIG
ncbi:MAG: CoA transferase, partial [Desulfocucumaceae bacterium]